MTTFDLEKEIGRNQAIIVDSALNYTGIVDWTRAVSLVVMKEATILIPRTDGTMVRSTHLVLPRPLVVSINRYVGSNIRKVEMEDAATRTMILVRDNWTCYVCKGYGDTMEHLMPRSRGGKSTWGNLAVACFECNGRKGDRTPDEMGWDWPVIPKTLVSKRRETIQQAIYDRLNTMSETPKVSLVS